MKKYIICILTSMIIFSSFPAAMCAEQITKTVSYNYLYDEQNGYSDLNSHFRRMESLNRGLIAVNTADGVYLSWRLWDSEDTLYGSADNNVSFNIYRDNKLISTVSHSTNYIDKEAGKSYCVAPVINGVEGDKCKTVDVIENNYFDIELNRPESLMLKRWIADKSEELGGHYEEQLTPYVCGDVSCGDLDGDGEYELVVTWLTSFSSSGMNLTDFNAPILLDAYKMDGTKLWEQPINLGVNIYTDQHNMQFLVYDFDGDGKAEITCQTSAGSKDALGKYVSEASADERVRAVDNSKDYRDNNGRSYTAPELFTIFNGSDGSAADTIYYPINICNPIIWGDAHGGHSTRFLADVSYLDGEKPYAVYWRGYYAGRTGVFGACFDGERLNVRYIFDTYDVKNSEFSNEYVGIPAYTDGNEIYTEQGNHNITTADVDNDGKDEVISGALCFEVNDEDKLMPKWCSFRQHGDALHIGDYDPTNPGLEYFSTHEYGGFTVTMPDGSDKTLDYGMTLYDAATGNELFHTGCQSDTKGGLLLNSGQGGYFQMSATTGVGTYIGYGNGKYEKADVDAGTKFRIFWDDDLYDEIADSDKILSWNGVGYENIFGATNCNGINPGGRAPVLQADLFGDWREEVVYPTEDYSSLRIFATNIPTNYKIKTLMHDPVYRSGVAAEQTATNMSPHTGFYVSKDLFDEEIPDIKVASKPNRTVYEPGERLNTNGLVVLAVYENGSTKQITDYELEYDLNNKGEQTVKVKYMGKTDEFTVFVEDIADIFIDHLPDTLTNYIGAPLNTDGLVVSARFSNGSTENLLPSDYTLSYTPELGEQTVTVVYKGKNASFKVSFIEANIGILNRTYFTKSTEASSVTFPIGICRGNFTLEHTMKINSMPADCGSGKNDTDGFYVRFVNAYRKSTGGGWYLARYGKQVHLGWKTSSSEILGTIDIGKTYKFKYEFTEAGTGNGARLKLTVSDENDKVIISVSNLDLRNFSASNKGHAISDIEIWNRANGENDASVTFGNAVLYGASGKISDFIDENIFVDITGLTPDMKVIAVKYNNNFLDKLETFNSLNVGENTITASFTPDKVFLWDDMKPLYQTEKQ